MVLKKLFLILTISFAVICFAGAVYVILSDGQASAGYAVIPMLLALVCSLCYRVLKNKGDRG